MDKKYLDYYGVPVVIYPALFKYTIKVYNIDGKCIPEIEDENEEVILSPTKTLELFNNQNYWDTEDEAYSAAKQVLINYLNSYNKKLQEGWINLYKSGLDFHPAIVGSSFVYYTKEEALQDAGPGVMATIKITWEE